jgi:hypothetical protein
MTTLDVVMLALLVDPSLSWHQKQILVLEIWAMAELNQRLGKHEHHPPFN